MAYTWPSTPNLGLLSRRDVGLLGVSRLIDMTNGTVNDGKMDSPSMLVTPLAGAKN